MARLQRFLRVWDVELCVIFLVLVLKVNAEPQGMEYTHVEEVQETDQKDDLTSSDSRMPTKLKLRFQMADHPVELNLTANDHIHSMVPVVLGEGENMLPWGEQYKEDFVVYTDEKMHASVLCRGDRTYEGDMYRKYMGTFRVGENTYSLEPSSGPWQPPPSPHTRTKRAVPMMDEVREEVYILKRAEYGREINYNGDTAAREDQPQYDYERELLGLIGSGENAMEKRVLFGVELLVVLDYAVYKLWYDKSQKSTQTEKHNDAINSIRYYYAHIVNGVDLRYRSISANDYGIYVALAGFYIATSPKASPFTEGDGISEYDSSTGFKYTDAYKSLDALEAWLEKQQRNLPYFDHAALLTANVLSGGFYKDGKRRHINGLADVKGICTKYRASVNEESGEFKSAQTVAHELGHSLGGQHDGTGSNQCTTKDQYVMASAPTVITNMTFSNAFKFSDCSVLEFRSHLNLLTVQGLNCLLNRATHVNQTEVNIHLSKPPGQVLNPDQQCQHIYGTESYYCGGAHNDAKICTELICFEPFVGECRHQLEQRAANGTTCGDGKWCYRGSCISHPEAPSVQGYCWSGDFQGKLSDGRTCPQMAVEAPWNCYKPLYSDPCCQTCKNLKDESKPGCEYGDHFAWCKDSTMKSDCYSASFKSQCCGTCSRANTGVQGCEYGDKASWCSTLEQRGCYVSGAVCCETCPRLITGPPGCEFGDQASWCPTRQRHECYQPHTRQLCCEFCEKFRTNVVGCEFGDISNYCRKSECSDSSNWKQCCHTCREEAGLATYPSTTPRVTTTPAPVTSSIVTQAVIATKEKSVSSTLTPVPQQSSTTTSASVCIDSATWCNDLSPAYCYTTDSICCQKCLQYNTETPGCKYGDKFTWCNNINPENCIFPTYQDDCCLTCKGKGKIITKTSTVDTTTTTLFTKQVNPSSTAAACTDKASWCPRIQAGDCYRDSPTCCSTCFKYRMPQHPDCEYGDAYTWCRDVDVFTCRSNEDISRWCCLTCPLFLPGTSSPKSTSPLITTSNVGVTTQRTPSTKSTTQSTPTTTRSSTESTVSTTQSTRSTVNTTQSTLSTISTTPALSSTQIPYDCQNEDTSPYCDQIASRDCYQYKDSCCQSCRAYYTGVPGCEFGDQKSWCQTIDLSSCVYPTFNLPCCQRCSGISTIAVSLNPEITSQSHSSTTKSSTPSTSVTTSAPLKHTTSATAACKEDLAHWCTDMHESLCYSNTDVCCNTCIPYYTGVKGCEFGDKAMWCADVIPSNCYYKDYQEKCCKSCAAHYTGINGCEYGDKADYCSLVDCDHPADYQYCCWTCGQRTSSPSPHPTTTTPDLAIQVCAKEDIASWCSGIPARNCYVEDDVCCMTCAFHYNGVGGCEYGDRVSWCHKYVNKVSDCQREDLIENCCQTCATIGYKLPESRNELGEGALIKVDTGVDKLQDNHLRLLNLTAEAINFYCGQSANYRAYCCHALGMQVVNESMWYPGSNQFVALSDSDIAWGYPKANGKEGSITKVLVKMMQSAVQDMCSDGSSDLDNDLDRKKRDLTEQSGARIYLDKTLLEQALLEYQPTIEKTLGFRIKSISFAEDAPVSSKSTNVTTIAATVTIMSIITIVIVIIVIIFYKVKLRSCLRTNSVSSELEPKPPNTPDLSTNKSWLSSTNKSSILTVPDLGAGVLTNNKTLNLSCSKTSITASTCQNTRHGLPDAIDWYDKKLPSKVGYKSAVYMSNIQNLYSSEISEYMQDLEIGESEVFM